MKMYILFALLLLNGVLTASEKMTPEAYIEKFSGDAIKEMKRSGVPASIKLAQGMLESSFGNSELAKKANNHFGIKCHNDWQGKKTYKDDDAKNECFRVYKHVLDSYKDHSDFLTGKQRYAFLFDLSPTDYKGWAKGLKQAGYATNPKYPELLINLIDRYHLHQFDVLDRPVEHKKNQITKTQKGVEGLEEIVVTHNHSILLSDNYVKYFLVATENSWEQISAQHGVGVKRLLKYNERKVDAPPVKGEKIYLQPKRRWAQEKYHEVKSGETLYSIAQHYGIKMKSICKRNRISVDESLKIGKTLKLKGRRVKK